MWQATSWRNEFPFSGSHILRVTRCRWVCGQSLEDAISTAVKEELLSCFIGTSIQWCFFMYFSSVPCNESWKKMTFLKDLSFTFWNFRCFFLQNTQYRDLQTQNYLQIGHDCFLTVKSWSRALLRFSSQILASVRTVLDLFVSTLIMFKFLVKTGRVQLLSESNSCLGFLYVCSSNFLTNFEAISYATSIHSLMCKFLISSFFHDVFFNPII